MHRIRRSLLSVCGWQLVAAVLGVSAALAQPENADAEQRSHWGVTASFIPQWNAVPELYGQLWGVSDFEPKGTEFRVGIMRGSDRGGDWSLTFVRNTVPTERIYDETERFDTSNGQSVLYGSRFVVPQDPVITGIKYEKFTPFVTIQDRVQIGMTYGGGIGALQGNVEETRFDAEFDFNPNTFQEVVTPTETVTQREVKDFYALEFVPIGSVELAAAVLLAPGLKARVSGGFNFPNTQLFSFTLSYLFGSR